MEPRIEQLKESEEERNHKSFIDSMRKTLPVLLLLGLFYACDKDFGDFDYEYDEQEYLQFNLSGHSLFILQDHNGNIEITGADTATNIYFDIIKTAKSRNSVSEAKSHIDDIEISFGSTADQVEVSVDHPNNTDIDYQVDFIITLPMNFDFRVINGNGNIFIISISKNLDVELGNGNIYVSSILPDTCAVNVDIGNGNMILAIPDNTNAGLEATVGNGSIINSGLAIQNQQSSGNHLTGTLGTGAGDIKLIIGNGNIDLQVK